MERRRRGDRDAKFTAAFDAVFGAAAEWKPIRYRLLHTAARITRGARQTWLRLAEGWPWAHALARAFTTLRRIPLPA